MRDDIERAASGDFAGILDEFAKLADSVNRHGDGVARLLMEHNAELAKLWDEVGEHGDSILALSNRIQGVANAAALSSELDDLRAEVREATATPFDPPPAA